MISVVLKHLLRNFLKKLYYINNWIFFIYKTSSEKTKPSHIDLSVRIKNPKGLKISNGTSINAYTFFDIFENQINSIFLGENVKIGDYCRFTTGHSSNRIRVGHSTTIHGSCHFSGDIEIGHSCLLSRNIYLSSYSHNFKIDNDLTIKEQDKLVADRGENLSKKIIIKDDVWLGWGCVIMPGVVIAEGTIIGSNAVVTKNTEAYGIYGGVPAKKISTRK